MNAITAELTNLANGSAAVGDRLAAKICLDAITEIGYLQGVVDKLSKTRDGVPVVSGMTLYREPGGYQFTLGEPCWDDLVGKWPSEYLRGADPSECCSTHEAAATAGGDDG